MLSNSRSSFEELEALHVPGDVAGVGHDLQLGHRGDEAALLLVEVAVSAKGSVAFAASRISSVCCDGALPLGWKWPASGAASCGPRRTALEHEVAGDGEGRAHGRHGGEEFASRCHRRLPAAPPRTTNCQSSPATRPCSGECTTTLRSATRNHCNEPYGVGRIRPSLGGARSDKSQRRAPAQWKPVRCASLPHVPERNSVTPDPASPEYPTKIGAIWIPYVSHTDSIRTDFRNRLAPIAKFRWPLSRRFTAPAAAR